MNRTKVLVLGGGGFVGRAVVALLQRTDWATPVVASRNAKSTNGIETIALDARDAESLHAAIKDAGAVINCVTGDGSAIAQGAQMLVSAALRGGMPRIVHMSTMSVYGRAEGVVDEGCPLQDDIGWYGHAKIAAERSMQRYSLDGGQAVILRPGCVVGAGSALWVKRVGIWLEQGRVGDLGIGGDGPANLVSVEDVAQAAVNALQMPLVARDVPVFNLVSPESPRWNDYFADFALAIGAIPLRTLGARRMKLDAYALGVPVKVLERVFSKLHLDACLLPTAIPPSLLGLWRQQIRLSHAAATKSLCMSWRSYDAMLSDSTQWFLSTRTT